MDVHPRMLLVQDSCVVWDSCKTFPLQLCHRRYLTCSPSHIPNPKTIYSTSMEHHNHHTLKAFSDTASPQEPPGAVRGTCSPAAFPAPQHNPAAHRSHLVPLAVQGTGWQGQVAPLSLHTGARPQPSSACSSLQDTGCNPASCLSFPSASFRATDRNQNKAAGHWQEVAVSATRFENHGLLAPSQHLHKQQKHSSLDLPPLSTKRLPQPQDASSACTLRSRGGL